MTKFEVQTGQIAHSFNGVEVSYNPTAPDFTEKLFKAFELLDGFSNEYQAKIKNAEGKEVFEIARELDRKAREIIDGVFDDAPDFCTSVFGSVNLFAFSGGLPLWANLLLMVVDEVTEAFEHEKKAMNPKIQKYTEKFRKH